MMYFKFLQIKTLKFLSFVFIDEVKRVKIKECLRIIWEVDRKLLLVSAKEMRVVKIR